MRESSPSMNSTAVATGTTRAVGKTRLMVRRGACRVPISRALPRMSATLTTLLPSASPSAILGVPFKAAVIETVSSGLDVAKAATVAATMPGEIRRTFAKPDGAADEEFAPTPCADHANDQINNVQSALPRYNRPVGSRRGAVPGNQQYAAGGVGQASSYIKLSHFAR
jgi:hypothetical protein